MTDQILSLEKAPGFLRKISINVLNKDAAFTLFTLPIEGIPLSREQLNAWLGEYTFESWYEQRKDGSWHPMPWWNHIEGGVIKLGEKYAAQGAMLSIENTDYAFEEYSADEEGDDGEGDDDMRPAARLSSLTLKATPGGVTMLAFHMQVRPGIGQTNLALQEHQFRHVAVTLTDTSVTGDKGKQGSLPFVDQTGHQSSPPIESRGGDAIDAELHARHPEASAEVMGADAPSTSAATTGAETDPAEELARFEEGAKQRAAEFQQRASGTIDGTTMRSRRRRPSEDATH